MWKSLFLLILLVGTVPAAAQTDANFTINAGGNSYNVTGGVLTIQLTNLAEEFFLATMSIDEKIFIEQLQATDLEANMIQPFEKNNSTRKETTTTSTYNTEDGGVIVITITTNTSGNSPSSTTMTIGTTKKKDDGTAKTDTITITMNPQEGPVIRTDP